MTTGDSIAIDGLDHLVLTVGSVDRTVDFYTRILGMRVQRQAGRPTALHFGSQKFNIHQAGQEFEPKARHPTPGGGDLCLLTRLASDEVVRRLERQGVRIELGPVERDGACGPMTSVYFRDPDDNLVEVATPS
ncbi:MAG: VOC family protein [Sneathiellaceae bacterium]